MGSLFGAYEIPAGSKEELKVVKRHKTLSFASSKGMDALSKQINEKITEMENDPSISFLEITHVNVISSSTGGNFNGGNDVKCYNALVTVKYDHLEKKEEGG